MDPAGTRYAVEGPCAAPVVVLVHGVGLDMSLWDGLSEALSNDASLVRYDLLGHGASTNPPGPRTLDDFVMQLGALADHLELARFRLAGFSMGGLVAQAFACRSPERLERLAILHSVFQRSADERAAVRARCEAVASGGPLANPDEALERWFSPGYRYACAERMDAIRTTFAAHRDDGYLKAYRVFAEADTEIDPEALARIDCPVLVATGSEDTGSTPRMALALARAIRGARCEILEGCRHMAPVEHVDRFNRLLRAFLTNGERET